MPMLQMSKLGSSFKTMSQQVGQETKPCCFDDTGSSHTFLSQDPFTQLKMTKDPKELLLMWIISIDNYHVRKRNRDS